MHDDFSLNENNEASEDGFVMHWHAGWRLSRQLITNKVDEFNTLVGHG